MQLNHPIVPSLQLVTDQVMGGVSRGSLTREIVRDRQATRMRGSVSLENNGGFVQMAANIKDDGSPFDATRFSGIELTVLDTIAAQGQDTERSSETYNLHLRTADITRPWQSYRQSFIADATWQTHRIAFADFAPHRIEVPLDTSRITRLGILAIGRAFEADISVANIAFYR